MIVMQKGEGGRSRYVTSQRHEHVKKKNRENRVSDVIAQSTEVEFFSRSDLSLWLQSLALSIHNQRCQKARRMSCDETDDSQLNAGSPESIFFHFKKKKISLLPFV
jgi:hypothetical protein